MAPTKLNIAVLCGGRSGEHEVSLLSAKSIISAIDREKYHVLVIGINKDGTWHLMNEEDFLIHPDNPEKIALNSNGRELLISPTPGKPPFHVGKETIAVDVIFPVLHGTYGEDGTVQGMLEMLSIPYVGADHLGSSAAMDKDVSKRLFIEAGLKVTKYVTFDHERDAGDLGKVVQRIESEIPYPLFVKPANLGSSVGISKASTRDELIAALHDAWQYDIKILVEEGIEGREIECAVIGNAHVEASELGEIIPHHDFYSYEAKYLDPDGAELILGTEVEPELKKQIQEMAKTAFRSLCLEGMARADFLVCKKTGTPYINELNTIPGFTTISMYPKLWEISGLPYSELIDRLIDLSLKRHEIVSALKTDFHKA